MATNGRMTFEPFLFGVAVIGVLYKIFQSVSDKQFTFDWIVIAIVLVFAVASLLWFFNARSQRRATSIDAAVATDNVTRSAVTGAEGRPKDKVKASVTTKDVTNSQITGFREK